MMNISELLASARPSAALDLLKRSVGLIGPTVVGKTTLFECVAGVLPSDRGFVQTGTGEIKEAARSTLLFYLPDGIAPWSSQRVQKIHGIQNNFSDPDRDFAC